MIQPYWVYVLYAAGCIGFWLIGHRKWYGWAITGAVQIGICATGIVLGLTWLKYGALTYGLFMFYMAYQWHRRVRVEAAAAQRFVKMVTGRFAEGKKEAIRELLQLQRDIDELTGVSTMPFGRRREDRILLEYLRRHGADVEAQEMLDRRGQL